MTRGKGIMGIFHQYEHFSKVLVVLGARVQALIVWWAKLYFSLQYIYIAILLRVFISRQ
jgi:hypothetical protein